MDPRLEIIAGDKPAKNLNRLADTDANIQAVRSEFIGKPEVCHELVSVIIYLRRGIDIADNTDKFYALLDEYLDEILEHYDLRWLISICDTIVDISDDATSAAAMNLVLTVNQLNMMATLLDIAGDGRPSLDKLAKNPGHKRPTWDGMIALDIYQGDTMFNMVKRLNTIMARDELLNELWEEIKHRLEDDRSVPVNWLCFPHTEESKKKYFHDE